MRADPRLARPERMKSTSASSAARCLRRSTARGPVQLTDPRNPRAADDRRAPSTSLVDARASRPQCSARRSIARAITFDSKVCLGSFWYAAAKRRTPIIDLRRENAAPPIALGSGRSRHVRSAQSADGHRGARHFRAGGDELSMHRPCAPPAISRRNRCEPMNPAPPARAPTDPPYLQPRDSRVTIHPVERLLRKLFQNRNGGAWQV